MKRKVVTILIVLALIIAAYFAVVGIRSVLDLKTYKNQVSDIKISNVDISKVPDGNYTGSCDTLWVAAEVKVTVKNHKIEQIQLIKHRNGRGKPAEIIPGKVVEAQSLNVDVVTGATVSSKVILKAIENALNSDQKK